MPESLAANCLELLFTQACQAFLFVLSQHGRCARQQWRTACQASEELKRLCAVSIVRGRGPLPLTEVAINRPIDRVSDRVRMSHKRRLSPAARETRSLLEAGAGPSAGTLSVLAGMHEKVQVMPHVRYRPIEAGHNCIISTPDLVAKELLEVPR